MCNVVVPVPMTVTMLATYQSLFFLFRLDKQMDHLMCKISTQTKIALFFSLYFDSIHQHETKKKLKQELFSARAIYILILFSPFVLVHSKFCSFHSAVLFADTLATRFSMGKPSYKTSQAQNETEREGRKGKKKENCWKNPIRTNEEMENGEMTTIMIHSSEKF